MMPRPLTDVAARKIAFLESRGAMPYGIALLTPKDDRLAVINPEGRVDWYMWSREHPKPQCQNQTRACSPSDVVSYDHHGASVKVRPDLKGKHRQYCLCYMCKKFKPGAEDNCPIAQAVYKNCVEFDIVTPMWECAKFEPMLDTDYHASSNQIQS